MKISKTALVILLLVLFLGHLSWALEEPKVTLEKKEGRTEAVVSVDTQGERKAPSGFFGGGFSMFEDGIMDTAAMTSRIVGKTTEIIVKGIGTAGSSLFSPLFKAVDLRERFEKNQG